MMRLLSAFTLFTWILLTSGKAISGWEVSPFDGKPDITPVEKFLGGVTEERVPGGLPDGLVSTATKGAVRKAWYEAPTRKYRHNILGDDIEAMHLVVEDAAGRKTKLELPDHLVFEDRYPRLADLNGDGDAEVITILSNTGAGAAIAVFGYAENRLNQIAKTPFIGRANRWRNVAGIADYNGDGTLEIMEVVTPHIGGTLNMWRLTGGKLKQLASTYGFSNHFIGSRDLELSVSVDLDGDDLPDIALPDRTRSQLRLMSGKDLHELATISLPGSVSGDIRLGERNKEPVIIVPVDGTDMSVSRGR